MPKKRRSRACRRTLRVARELRRASKGSVEVDKSPATLRMVVVVVLEILLEDLDDEELILKGDGPVFAEAHDGGDEEALAGVKTLSDVARRRLVPREFEASKHERDGGVKELLVVGA